MIMVASLSLELVLLSMLAIPVSLFVAFIFSEIGKNAFAASVSALQTAEEASASVTTCQSHVRTNTANNLQLDRTIPEVEQSKSHISTKILEKQTRADLVLVEAKGHLQQARFFSYLPKEEVVGSAEEFKLTGK